jgi:hypothetical protein
MQQTQQEKEPPMSDATNVTGVVASVNQVNTPAVTHQTSASYRWTKFTRIALTPKHARQPKYWNQANDTNPKVPCPRMRCNGSGLGSKCYKTWQTGY